MGEPAPPEAPSACPRCGTPFEPGQEYCLECGLRLPQTTGVLAGLRSVIARRSPWYPGDWIWPVLIGLVIAGILTAILITTKGGNEGGTGGAFVATNTSGLVAPTTEPTTTITPPEPTTATTQTQTQPSPPPKKELVEWPADKNGYTLVLFSIPTSAGRGAATTKARSALQAGLPKVGVLASSEFSSLHPGYYVVFSGIYSSPAQAQNARGAAADTGYPDAYMRQISR